MMPRIPHNVDFSAITPVPFALNQDSQSDGQSNKRVVIKVLPTSLRLLDGP